MGTEKRERAAENTKGTLLFPLLMIVFGAVYSRTSSHLYLLLELDR